MNFSKANDEVKLVEAIKEAIKIGYRHLDCAWVYGNEDVIGRALKYCFEQGVKREDLFIVTKVPPP